MSVLANLLEQFSDGKRALASQAVMVLAACYRDSSVEAPEVFVEAQIYVLCHYPDHVIRKVVDPFHGLPSKCKFLPSIAELKQECEAILRPPDRFFTSTEWRQVRYQAIKRSNRHCECCGSDKPPLHVDHIKPRSKFPDLALGLDNLQVLCADCNLGKGSSDQIDWRAQ